MTIVAKPDKKTRQEKIEESLTCESCYVVEASTWDDYFPSRMYRMNTVFKCSQCPQLWVARPSIVPFIWFEHKWAPRKLRWYHWANRHINKEVPA